MDMVIVAREKHGTFLYSTALGLLKQRVEEGHWYDAPTEKKAQKILSARDEKRAWLFLNNRRDNEYEYVERQEVR